MAYSLETFGQKIKQKYPQYNDMEDRDLGMKMLSKYPEYNDVVADHAGVKSFITEKGPSTSLAKNFAKSLPSATFQVGVGSPIKLGVSGLEQSSFSKLPGVKNLIGSGKTYDLPGLQPFKSFQSESRDRAVAGQNTILNVLQGAGEVALATADTLGTGKGLSKLTSVAEKQLANLALRKSINNVIKAENLAGKIIQGKSDDILQAKKALNSINVSEVKTYKDLENVLTDKIEGLSSKLDETLLSKSGIRKLDQLMTKTKAGNEIIKTNYVEDALKQLEDFFIKTNDTAGQVKIKGLIAKAQNNGLNIKEINDIARLHGDRLNAYNASGQLASGLTKQAAENTRKGVKSTARTLFGNKAYEEADSQLSALINTKNSITKMKEAVNTLQQKVMQRNFGQKVGRLMANVVDKLTGGGIKGFIQTFIPRGEGLKTFNALDLEKMLPKMLKQLQKASQTTDEATLIKTLEDIIKTPSSLEEIQTIVPATLKYFGKANQNTNKLIKVNNYQELFPKYLTPDQIKRATQELVALKNKGKKLDMNVVNMVIKKFKPMSDIKNPR